MKSVFHYVAPPSQCGYLPEQVWRLEYEHVAALSPVEYRERLLQGWRRFGHALFRPRCPACSACQSLRVDVRRFRPDRSQRRARKANEGIVALRIGPPSVTRAKLTLYDRYHSHQAAAKGWPEHPAKDAQEYVGSFVDNPLPTEEWCYYLGSRLVGVGYVDVVPGGLSAIYFFYDPEERQRSLGTWNVLSILDAAAARKLPHVYLGYYVAGCQSMEYKARFVPNEVLGPDGSWRQFRS
jgi:arginine-tRNA-protein transferase